MNNEEVMKKMENMRDSKALSNYLTQESDVSYLIYIIIFHFSNIVFIAID